MKTLHDALQNGHMKPFNSSSFDQPVIFTLWLSVKTTNLILRTVLTQIRISSKILFWIVPEELRNGPKKKSGRTKFHLISLELFHMI